MTNVKDYHKATENLKHVAVLSPKGKPINKKEIKNEASAIAYTTGTKLLPNTTSGSLHFFSSNQTKKSPFPTKSAKFKAV